MPVPELTTLEISVDEAASLVCPNRPLIDIRDERERLTGLPRGATVMSAEELLARCRRAGESAPAG